jgi:hypothetical protein
MQRDFEIPPDQVRHFARGRVISLKKRPSAGVGSAVPPERVIGSEPERRWVRLKPFPLSLALLRRVLHARGRSIRTRLSVCPEMIFRLRKPFGNKDANSDCLTGRKTSLFSNFFGNLGNNSLWL